MTSYEGLTDIDSTALHVWWVLCMRLCGIHIGVVWAQTNSLTFDSKTLASFPGLSGEGGKAWGLLRAHARKLPQNVVIAYYSNLSATFVCILSVKAWERG